MTHSDMSPEDIRILRAKLNVSKTRFAAMIGVTPDTLRQWEVGKTHPNKLAVNYMRVLQQRHEMQLAMGEFAILDEAE